MPTKFPEVFKILSEPIPPNRIRIRVARGEKLQYVNARTVMTRLDEALGPENWHFESEVYHQNQTDRMHFVISKGTLTITLPDGTKVSHTDYGGAGNPDYIIALKGSKSDAIKRCAVRFGVARELGGNFSPEYDECEAGDIPYEEPSPPKAAPAKAVMFSLEKARALPRKVVSEFKEFAESWCDSVNAEIMEQLKRMPHFDGKIPSKLEASLFRLCRHFHKIVLEAGLSVEVTDNADFLSMAALIQSKSSSSFNAKLKEYREQLINDAMNHIA